MSSEESLPRIALPAISIAPCQICGILNNRFYLCENSHTTCENCKSVRYFESPTPKTQAKKKQVSFSEPLTSNLLLANQTSPSRLDGRKTNKTLPSSPKSPISEPGVNLPSPSTTSCDNGRASRRRIDSNRPPSCFSFNSPIKSLVPSVDDLRDQPSNSPLDSIDQFQTEQKISTDQATQHQDLSYLEIFCVACDSYVEAHLVNLPPNVVKLMKLRDEQNKTVEVLSESDEEPEETTMVPTTSSDQVTDVGLRNDVDFLRIGLVNAFNELLITREHLDEVMVTTDRLEMDVNMLRGGKNYVFFDFAAVLKRKEVWLEELVSDIPFIVMVRLRSVAKVPHLGFFIGLDLDKGRKHSPLKCILVMRAHNASGKVVEKHTLKTFENGQCVHPCFDVTKKPANGSLWGYSDFITQERIQKPGMLKNGLLCLSLEVTPL